MLKASVQSKAFVRTGMAIVAVAVLLFGSASTVLANASGFSPNVAEVTVTAGPRTGSFSGDPFPGGTFSTLFYDLPGSVTIQSNDVDQIDMLLLETLNIGFAGDPQVDLAFSLLNLLDVPITVSIRTGTIQFSPLVNPDAVASASLTITDAGGAADGVSLAGQFAPDKAYQARYSTSGAGNTQTAYASLVGSFNTAGLGADSTEDTNGGLFSPLAATVYMMEAEYQFILSAGDQASGTSTFVVVPEPATLAFLALGGLLAARRRRMA
jgi:hypothetical protein